MKCYRWSCLLPLFIQVLAFAFQVWHSNFVNQLSSASLSEVASVWAYVKWNGSELQQMISFMQYILWVVQHNPYMLFRSGKYIRCTFVKIANIKYLGYLDNYCRCPSWMLHSWWSWKCGVCAFRLSPVWHLNLIRVSSRGSSNKTWRV